MNQPASGPPTILTKAPHLPRLTIHCEVWAGSPSQPYRWLLTRDEATTPVVAVRRLRAAAWWLADRLDDDLDDPRLTPSAALRLWLGDAIGHGPGSDQLAAELAERLAAGAYLADAVSVTGHDAVRYTLTAMPEAGCVCGAGSPTGARPAGEPRGAVLAGGWAR
ncbi:hypothetical protein [Streptomyces hydrogenans]|uniref:hypothetical protein n=1 Tax=Streptomyces hydrogenans TaxID=1873719 RepID=UPI0036DFC28E